MPTSGPPASTPANSNLRAAVARASHPVLSRISALPRVVPFLAMLGLLLVGLFVGGVIGGVCTGIVALFVAWLLYLSWPRLTTSERLGRLAVLLLALALCVVQFFPRS
ncbi:DUF6703 family protein [Angustibacter sp. McL0619]|uniref:DUF6703 family protein n=1 Tax=Angustibacter sp. McL0619 TaxID=3415676 RepID=UPI003CFADECE